MSDQQPLPPLALSIKDASKRTGIGMTTLYRLVAEGAIPHRKIGKKIVFPAASFERWLNDTDRAV